jgi:hypothetical protein
MALPQLLSLFSNWSRFKSGHRFSSVPLKAGMCPRLHVELQQVEQRSLKSVSVSEIRTQSVGIEDCTPKQKSTEPHTGMRQDM